MSMLRGAVVAGGRFTGSACGGSAGAAIEAPIPAGFLHLLGLPPLLLPPGQDVRIQLLLVVCYVELQSGMAPITINRSCSAWPMQTQMFGCGQYHLMAL